MGLMYFESDDDDDYGDTEHGGVATMPLTFLCLPRRSAHARLDYFDDARVASARRQGLLLRFGALAAR